MIGGYMDKVLYVDLSNNSIEDIYFDDEIKRKFIGGYGYGAKFIYERQKAGVDPLCEDSVFGVLAGPLTGTNFPAVSRFTICGKSPLTNTWGDSNGSGNFGPMLKFAGLDGLFIKGTSESPIYILIDNGKLRIEDATSIWGKDTYKTEDLLKAIHGQNSAILCIGPSGENISLISAVITSKGRAAARGGLAAILGSKKLKAIVVKGNYPVKIADKNKFNIVKSKFRKNISEGCGFADTFKTTGTPGHTEVGILTGDSPIKNWFGVPSDMNDFSQLKYENIEKYKIAKKGCYACPIACWGHVMIKSGHFALKEPAHMPEYETCSSFGSYCLNNNFESIIKCNDICNRYGIDTISAGAVIAFAIDCYERGIINKRDADGIELTWGNSEAIVKMTEKLAKSEGFGKILSQGVKKAALIIGRGAEDIAIHVQGQELPAHDTRLEPSLGVIYTLDATPGRHTQAATFGPPPNIEKIFPDIVFKFNQNSYLGRAKAEKILLSLVHSIDSLGVCQFGYLSTDVTTFPECFSAVTGWNVDVQELVITGERIGTIRHLFNLRENLNPIKFPYPKIAQGIPKLTEGPLKGIKIELKAMQIEYYKEMGWDLETGMLSNKKLKELELDNL